MNTRLLIIIGIIVSLTAVIASDQFASRNTSSHFNYVDTKSVTQDTYLDKTVSQWQDESFDSMMSYYDIHDDLFFERLGALVIKNEMLNELNKQNISAVNPDFKVYPGMVLTSLPPHVSFEAFVNGTNGNTYRLTGMTQLAKIDQPVHITKLQFFDTGVQLSSESILSKNNTVIIRDQDTNESQVIPHNFVISGNKDIVVNFQNNNLVPIRIQGDGDWINPTWYGPIILPMTAGSMTFDKFGVYDWHSRTLPLPGSIASDYMGGGQINIIPDDIDTLTFQDKQSIGSAILQNSEIPWSGIWSNNTAILIEFNEAILDVIPNAKEYYETRAEQLIPFDIPITVEEPYRWGLENDD